MNLRRTLASPAVLPRISLITRRTFRGDILIHLACALLCMALLRSLSSLVAAGMAFEKPRRCEFTQPVTDHLLGYVHRHVLAAVVDCDRVPNHVGDNHGRPSPALNNSFLTLPVHVLDLFHQAGMHVGSFFQRPSHFFFPRFLTALFVMAGDA